MSQGVELYGVRLESLPIVGERIDDPDFLQSTANGLAIARGLGGPAIAGYILAHSPEERSWAVGVPVAALAATDRLDGDIIRALHETMTEQELQDYKTAEREGGPTIIHRLGSLFNVDVPTGKADYGAWLDHMADKAFVIPPMGALALRGEISPVHLPLKIRRDIRVGGIKNRMHDLIGKYPSAPQASRWKATVEMAGVAVASSPLASKRAPGGARLHELAFSAATLMSEQTAQQYAKELQDAVVNVRVGDIEELLIDGPNPETTD